MNIISITNFITEYEQQKKQFQERVSSRLKEVFKEFFRECPEIKTISWLQYTPYFNDGDECIFSVKEVYFSNVEKQYVNTWGELEEMESSNDTDLYNSNDYEIRNNPNISTKSKELIKSLSEILESTSMSDIMKNVFGDHVFVRVDKDGIDIEQHNHD